MDVITIDDPNFIVKPEGLRLESDDGTVVEFYEGDGVRIANRDSTACIEFNINDRLVSMSVNKADFKQVLGMVEHSSEYKVQTMELMDAMRDNTISNEALVESYAKAHEAQKNKTTKTVAIERRIKEMTFDEKVRKVVEEQVGELPEDANSVTLVSVKETSGDNFYDEVDEDEIGKTLKNEEGEEGEECDIDGAKGTLKMVDGALTCVVDETKESKSTK